MTEEAFAEKGGGEREGRGRGAPCIAFRYRGCHSLTHSLTHPHVHNTEREREGQVNDRRNLTELLPKKQKQPFGGDDPTANQAPVETKEPPRSPLSPARVSVLSFLLLD